MKNSLRKINKILILIGINILDTKNFLGNIFWYFKCLFQFKISKEFKLSFFPILGENKMNAGSVEDHYFIQDLYVSQSIFSQQPENILDVGSRIDGFVSNVASFRKIDIVDIRPLSLKIKNINFKRLDITKNISKIYNQYTCVTSLHAIEHFGLGRYGDKIDPEGHLKGIKNIYKILKKSGILYLSFPFGPNRIEFNAHRVFSLSYIEPKLTEFFEIIEFSYIDDQNTFHQDIKLDSGYSNNFNCNYGCAIFKLKKK